ncbi:MAG: 2-dehydropantoate 2-reductase [Pseudomonadota bacterium]|nr:2-dehydropantoate 2-reductase [Pseudomonadota bacterium]
MKICIVGAGAIGGFLAVKLANSGHVVSVVARGDHLKAIKRDGLKLRINGIEEKAAVIASTDVPKDPQDYVFVTVKEPAMKTLHQQVASLAELGATIIPAMNGLPHWYFYRLGNKWENYSLESVDSGGFLKLSMPFESVLGTVVYPASEISSPGVIRHIEGNRFSLAEPDGSKSERLQILSETLFEAGFRAPISKNIRNELWVKLWGNLAFNPISCLTGGTLRQICDDPDTVEVVRLMMEEARLIGEEIGVRFPFSIEKRIAGARAVGEHKTSMLQDLEAGRLMEIDSIVGSVQELGKIVKVETPTIDTILALTKQRALMAGCYSN